MAPPNSAAALHSRSPPDGVSRTPELVLVVDDTEANRYAMARILRAGGYEVVAAESGQQALALARDRLPAVIVLDVLLPDIMGFEVCARLKRDPATSVIPVLQVSASYTTDHDRAHGLNDGADGYLVQPIDPSVLLATVKALLRLKSTHAALHHSEARLRALLQSAPVILFAVDRNGKYSLVTGSFLQRLDLSGDTMVGHSIYSLHSGERQFLANATRALTGESFADELQLYGRWFEVRYSPMHDLHARPDGFVAVATDISDRKSAERAREDLLAIVAHDLRTPLTGIQLNIEVLKRAQAGAALKSSSPEEVLKTMERSARRAERLVTDLLDHAKMEAGTFTVDRAPQDLESLLRDATEVMAPIADEKDVRIRLEVRKSASLNCDGGRLLQAMCNLLDNAVKFSPAGGVVTVYTNEDLAEHIITVEDQGPGVAASDVPRLFDRFSQGTVNRKQGTGLGLSIASGIVRAHGGRIWVENGGSGARFCLALPK